MILTEPIWLALLVPLAVAAWVWPWPSRLLNALRWGVVLLLLLALARPTIRWPSRGGSLVIVADRSASMPAGHVEQLKEVARLAQAAMRGGDRLGVVSFGRRVAVEQAPQAGGVAGFDHDVGGEQSHLAEALEAALALLPSGEPAQILVVSDGLWTGRDPAEAVARAGARGVPIAYRRLARPAVGDVAIAELKGPDAVAPGQAFMLSARLQAPAPQTVRYVFERGGQTLAAGEKTLEPGLNRLLFRDRAGEPGALRYTLRVTGPADDPRPENNQARLLVGVEGRRPVLCVTDSEASGLVRLMRTGALPVTARAPEACRWTLDELGGYSAVVLENAPASRIGSEALRTLALWVEQTGAGLMLTGGRQAYGPGGYFRSPLERVLPVTMELRREHRKLAVAIVVALDRSGSMAAPVGGGRTKMDCADLGTAQVLDLLSEMDEFGAIAVDSAPHVVVPLTSVEQARAYRTAILSIESMGGGIFIYEALKAAAGQLSKAKAQTKHLILFADAADSEEPGAYIALLDTCRSAGVTVSVVGLGSPSDCDAHLLEDIARRGGGRCLYTADADEIPRLFAQETFTVARSAFVEETTPVRLVGGFAGLTDLTPGQPPAVGGYNLCYLRPEATLAARTEDEYQAPLVAYWRVGLGRALCFTGEADGQYAGPLARWERAGDFYLSQMRWVAGLDQPLPEGMHVAQTIRNGQFTVALQLDPERETEPFSGTPVVRILRGEPGRPPESLILALRWKTADSLAAETPVAGGETLLATVQIPGGPAVSLPPTCPPYGAEFAPVDGEQGRLALERMARATGGRACLDVSGIWKTMPRGARQADLRPWLIGLACALLLVEILQRRTGMLGLISRVKTPRRRGEERPEGGPSPADGTDGPRGPAYAKASAGRHGPSNGKSDGGPSSPMAESDAPPDESGEKTAGPAATQTREPTLSAFQKARRRAKDRMGQ